MTANSKNRNGFNRAAKKSKTEFVTVHIPAHREIDGLSMYEDGMAGKLRNVSNSYLEAAYGYDVPAHDIQLRAYVNAKPYVTEVSPGGRKATVVFPDQYAYDVRAIQSAGVSGNLKWSSPESIEERYTVVTPGHSIRVNNDKASIKAAKANQPKR